MNKTIIPRYFLITLAIWFAGLWTIAQASDQVNACIEGQANGLEITSDMQNLLDEYKINSTNSPESLSAKEQYILCRQLGLKEDRFKAFWPSQKEAVKLFASSDINQATQDVFKSHGETALAELKREYGVELAYPVNILIGTNKHNIWQAWERALPHATLKSYFEQEFSAVCTDEYSGGFAIHDTFIMCPIEIGINYDSNVALEERDADIAYTAEVIFFHELFHVAQDEISGNHWFCQISSTGCAFDAPIWFVEGSADFFSDGYTHHSYRGKMNKLIEQSSIAPSALHKLEADREYSDDPEDIYRLGAAAIYYLMLDREKSAIIEAYDNLARGYSWEDAFKLSMDITVQEFYEEFSNFD